MMDWFECNKKRIVKEVSVDEELISSLLKTSEKKILSEQLLPLNETTSESKISLAYDSLRELLEALAIKNRFKIYNHDCYTSFLKEVIKKSELGDEFDSIRKIRNSINYYGKQITVEECVSVVKQTKELIAKIKSLL